MLIKHIFSRCAAMFKHVQHPKLTIQTNVAFAIGYAITMSSVTKAKEECGNEYTSNGHSGYEHCNTGVLSSTASLVILPMVTMLAMTCVTARFMLIINRATLIKYEVKWPRYQSEVYLNAAYEMYGNHLAFVDRERLNRLQSAIKLYERLALNRHSTGSVREAFGMEGTFRVVLDIQSDNPIPFSLSYMHARLRTHWAASIINVSWAASNAIMVGTTVLGATRSGTYWKLIGIGYSGLIFIHLLLVIIANVHLVPKLIASGLRRSIFENFRKFGLAVFTIYGDQPMVTPISYLDQHEQYGGPPTYLDNLEKAAFIKAYNEALMASKSVRKSQESLMSGSGSSAIGAVLLIISSFRDMDVNGTTSSLNALSLTFAIAALAQAVAAVSHLADARLSSETATETIEQINKVWDAEPILNWTQPVYQKLARWRFLWGVHETPVTQTEALKQSFYDQINPFKKGEEIEQAVGLATREVRQQVRSETPREAYTEVTQQINPDAIPTIEELNIIDRLALGWSGVLELP